MADTGQEWHAKVRRRPTAQRAAHIYVALDYALERGHSIERAVLWGGYWGMTVKVTNRPYEIWTWVHAPITITTLEQVPGEVNARQIVTGGQADGPPVPIVLWYLMYEEGDKDHPRWGGFPYETGKYKITNGPACKEVFRRHWPLMLARLAREVSLVPDTPDIILAAYIGEELGNVALQMRILSVTEYLESDRLLPPERLKGKLPRAKLNRNT